MYWFRIESAILMLSLLSFFLLIGAGGWLIARNVFRMPGRIELPVGLALGVVLFIFAANILAQLVTISVSFWIAAALVFITGILAQLRFREPLVFKFDKSLVIQCLGFFSLAVMFTLMARGLGIFDDRKNLSLISIMAAGDVPPHFYMNSEYLFGYHYGFQLLGAAMMRIGGLFPWSAFDLSKGLIASLALWLAYVWGRNTHKSLWPGLVFAFVLLFATGTRWLWLLLPPSLIQTAGSGVQLWGSGAESALTLAEGLSAAWVIDGGPPTAIPFAFVNGILQPFILYLQAGPRSLALVIIFTLLIIRKHRRQAFPTVIIVLLLATWALVAEAEFALFVLGMGFLTFLTLTSKFKSLRSSELPAFFGITLVAGLISLFQGGTITEMVRAIVEGASPGGVARDLGPDIGFSLRLPPAVISSHLGELRIFDVWELLIGLSELGPLILLIPIAFWMTRRYLRNGDYLMGAFGTSTFFGAAVPLLIKYSVDRDVTRMTQHALVGWLILSWPYLRHLWARGRASWRLALAGGGFAAVLGGLVVLGPLLTAMHSATFADEIAPLDAVMLRSNWDALEPGSEVLDSKPWRSVVVTGRLTRSSKSGYEALPDWVELVSTPDPNLVAESGYSYVYIDEYWWESMSEDQQSKYANGCALLVDMAIDNAENGTRWLYDVRSCE